MDSAFLSLFFQLYTLFCELLWEMWCEPLTCEQAKNYRPHRTNRHGLGQVQTEVFNHPCSTQSLLQLRYHRHVWAHGFVSLSSGASQKWCLIKWSIGNNISFLNAPYLQIQQNILVSTWYLVINTVGIFFWLQEQNLEVYTICPTSWLRETLRRPLFVFCYSQ